MAIMVFWKSVTNTTYVMTTENDCLTPLKTQYFARCWNNTSTTITLLMPNPRRPANCTNITMAAPKFQLFYGPDNSGCAKNFSLCQSFVIPINSSTVNPLSSTNSGYWIFFRLDPIRLLSWLIWSLTQSIWFASESQIITRQTCTRCQLGPKSSAQQKLEVFAIFFHISIEFEKKLERR